MARGSPLNLALIAHWDGWQPFGSSFRGCGSFEVSIANMTKTDMCHVEEVYVVGFVPCSDLLKDLPEYLDPFLKPLMDDLSKGFISGYNIPYPLQFTSGEFHSSAIENIRFLLLCWSGGPPGQWSWARVKTRTSRQTFHCRVSSTADTWCSVFGFARSTTMKQRRTADS